MANETLQETLDALTALKECDQKNRIYEGVCSR